MNLLIEKDILPEKDAKFYMAELVLAIESIHKQIVESRDSGTAVLLISLELDEVMNLSDRILVMYEGEITGHLDPKTTTIQELGLYMSGAKRDDGKAHGEGGVE